MRYLTQREKKILSFLQEGEEAKATSRGSKNQGMYTQDMYGFFCPREVYTQHTKRE